MSAERAEPAPQNTSGTPEKALPEILTSEEQYALRQLERLSESLLESLRNDIEKGTIGTIVGVDSSGRIPALLVSKVIKRIYAKRSFRPLETRFLKGKIHKNPIALKRLPGAIEEMDISKDRKVLVVDEAYTTGTSVRSIMETFKEFGYQVELVVFSSFDRKSMKEKYVAHHPTENEFVEIFKRYRMSGVTKDTDSEELHATPNYKLEFADEDLEVLPAVREALNEMAERIALRYESKNN